MANHCWNAVSIEGDKETLDKLQAIFNKYETVDYFADFGNLFFVDSDTFDPVAQGDYHQYGTKWWEFDITREHDEFMQVNGDSAWSSVAPLMLMISEEYQVRCTINFSESGCDFAGVYIYDKGNIEQQHDCSYAQYIYDQEEGVESLISDYLYEEERYEYYENADNFITSLGVDGVTSEDMEILDNLFKENLPPMLNKKETIDNLAEILQSLKHLEMNGLAAKVEHIHTVLSNEWEEDLKPQEDEQKLLVK
jgi:hypothetical protein